MMSEENDFLTGLKKVRTEFAESPNKGNYKSGFSKEEKRECSQCGYVGFVQPTGFEPEDVPDGIPEYLNVIWYSRRFKREVCLKCNGPGWKLSLLGQKPKKLVELSKMSARERKELRRKGYLGISGESEKNNESK